MNKEQQHVYVLTIEPTAIRLFLIDANTHTIQQQYEMFYTETDFTTHNNQLFEGVYQNIKQTIKKNRKQPVSLYVVFCSHAVQFVRGEYTYHRDVSESPIEQGEIRNILQNAQARNAGCVENRSLCTLLHNKIEAIYIDGEKKTHIREATGSDVSITFLSFFIRSYWRDFLLFLEQQLGCKVVYVYEPLITAHTLQDAVVFNMSTKNTSVQLIKNYQLYSMECVLRGEHDIISEIGEAFGIEKKLSYQLLSVYTQGNISNKTHTAVCDVLDKKMHAYWEDIEQCLKVFSVKGFLPHTLYLHSTQDVFCVFNDIIQNRDWKKRFSFKDTIHIQHIENNFSRVIEYISQYHTLEYSYLNSELDKVKNLI